MKEVSRVAIEKPMFRAFLQHTRGSTAALHDCCSCWGVGRQRDGSS